jgi:myo-inositol-1(or 4)-monophosphatase
VSEVLLKARERGLTCISITDNDTLAALEEAIRVSPRFGVTVIPGIELTALDRAREVVILGYGFSLPAPSVAKLCSSRDAPRSTVSEVIRAVHADGGVAVLASPIPLDGEDDFERLVAEGFDGVELNSPHHPGVQRERIRDIGLRLGLVMTGGSDFGRRGADIGDFPAPIGAAERLLFRHSDEVEWAVSVVREAGSMARKAACGDVDSRLKNNNIRDLVTAHDVAIEKFLTDAIRNRDPASAFITEEHDHPPPGDTPVWIIDPIDGTTNFVASGDYFAVSVARFQGRSPRFGIVFDVMADELYLGLSGSGSSVNGRPFAGRSTAEQPKPLNHCVVEVSYPSVVRLREQFNADVSVFASDFRAQRALGCAAIGICRIARGTLDIYISTSLSVWDYAAAFVVLKEAGGVAATAELPAAAGYVAVDGHAAGAADAAQAAGSGRSANAGRGTGSASAAGEPDDAWYHQRRRLFIAASSRGTFDDLVSRLFPDRRPALTDLATLFGETTD